VKWYKAVIVAGVVLTLREHEAALRYFARSPSCFFQHLRVEFCYRCV